MINLLTAEIDYHAHLVKEVTALIDRVNKAPMQESFIAPSKQAIVHLVNHTLNGRIVRVHKIILDTQNISADCFQQRCFRCVSLSAFD